MTKSTEQQERGQRVTDHRKQLKMSRRAFADKYGMSENTLRAWEQGLQGGLTEKGAKILVHIFRQEGLPCSVEWLMNGKQLPRDYATKTDKQVFTDFISARSTIENELAAFKKIHPSLIYSKMEDDSMLPHFSVGDLVAGLPIPHKDFVLAINLLCIVETEHEKKLIRRIMPGSKPGSYHLFSTNLNTTVEKPIIYDIGLISIAPINLHRKLFLI